MSTSPSFGVGTDTCFARKTSGPPKRSIRTARILGCGIASTLSPSRPRRSRGPTAQLLLSVAEAHICSGSRCSPAAVWSSPPKYEARMLFSPISVAGPDDAMLPRAIT
jgi:hypothetical protein